MKKKIQNYYCGYVMYLPDYRSYWVRGIRRYN